MEHISPSVAKLDMGVGLCLDLDEGMEHILPSVAKLDVGVGPRLDLDDVEGLL